MKKRFAYQWLDNLITHVINPDQMDALFPVEYINEIKEKLTEKEREAMIQVKNQIFQLSDMQEIHLTVKRYNDELISLIGKLNAYLYHKRRSEQNILDFYEHLNEHVHHILEVLRREFSAFLTSEVHAPQCRLHSLREVLRVKIHKLEDILSNGTHGKEPFYIIKEIFDAFIERVNENMPIRESEVDYLHELVAHIERIGQGEKRMSSCPALHELLIYWNLNSSTCIAYFVHGMEGEIRQRKSYEEKLEFLRYQWKNLQQLPQKTNFSYNPEYPNIKEYFLSWIQNELDYLEMKSEGFEPMDGSKSVPDPEKRYKLRVDLTADQIGIILRTLDETRLIEARSLSMVFRSIVPYLSTPHAEDPSWNNMRGRSYEIRDQDKEVVRAALKKLDRHIEAL